MSDALKGRVALVTGASRGIGRSIALALAFAGCQVAVNYRAGKDKADEVVHQVEAAGGKAIAVAADVSDPTAVTNMVKTVRGRLGPIDILVNNAGMSKPHSLDSLTLEAWDEHFALNVRAAYVVSAAVIPEMRARRWGRLIYISSIAARLGGIVGPHYAGSKAAVEGMMHGYAAFLAKEGITANAISPSLIDTDMVRSNDPAVLAAALATRVPVGRLGTPEEISGMAVLLASNAFVTGQTIHMNGGTYMT